MRYFVVIIIAVLIGCGDKSDTGNPLNNNGTNSNSYGYFIETEPSISPDRKYVYFIAADTTDGTGSGIYRARTTNPIRELVKLGNNFHSPTSSPDRSQIAYLESGMIRIYNTNTDSVNNFDDMNNYKTIVFLNDSLLVSEKANSIYIVNIRTGVESYYYDGYDINSYKKDTVISIKRLENSRYQITKLALSNIPNDKASAFNVIEIIIDTIISNSTIHWASVEPLANRYSYSVGNTIYVSNPQAISPKKLVTAKASKPLILDYNLIIYTGPGGRLYYSDYDGVNIFPFWGAINNSD